ncbi:Meiotic activator RIM4 [Nakaseomyces bracarensis]|uniref:Meiotic activator RIM4 n=1 Tax=Nakaseomyces bracarensis TaxID=273131 RepID=A0ABR4NTC5_9SACH
MLTRDNDSPYEFLEKNTESESDASDDVESDVDDVEEAEEADGEAEEVAGSTNIRVADTIGDYKGRPSACLFVASLAATLEDDELCVNVTQLFRQYGDLVGVKVLRDDQNRPYAFVQYKKDKDAHTAQQKASGAFLNGRKLRCEAARVNRTLLLYQRQPFVYRDLVSMCEKFGELEMLVPGKSLVSQNFKAHCSANHNDRDRWCAWFVQFVYREDAIRAFANLKETPSSGVLWVQNIQVKSEFNYLNTNMDRDLSPGTSSPLNYLKYRKNDSGDGRTFMQQKDEGFELDKNSVSSYSTDKDLLSSQEHGSNSSLSQSSVSSTSNHSSDSGLKYSRRNGFNTNYINNNSGGYSRFETPIIDKRSIFVGQLEPEVTTTLLKNRFSKHGKIVDINLIDKPTSVFAFIKFETEQAAASALNKEDHTILINRTMHVQYKEVSGYMKKSSRKLSYHNNDSHDNTNNNENKLNVNNNQTHSQTFAAPEAKAAPPPVGKYRYENENGIIPSPFMGFPMNGSMNDYGMLQCPFVPLNKGSPPNRQTSFKYWSSIRSNNTLLNSTDSVVKDDEGSTESRKTSSNGESRSNSEKDYTLENSESAGRIINSNSTTTSNQSYFDKQTYFGNGNGNYTYIPRRKFNSRRQSYGYVDHPRNFFPPSYIYPFQYHMGAMPTPGSPGSQNYMIFPMLPPPPSGVDNAMLPPPMGMPQPNVNMAPLTPITPTAYLSTDSPKFIPEKKAFALDY